MPHKCFIHNFISLHYIPHCGIYAYAKRCAAVDGIAFRTVVELVFSNAKAAIATATGSGSGTSYTLPATAHNAANIFVRDLKIKPIESRKSVFILL